MPTYATYRPQNSQSASQYFSTDTIEKMAAISSPNLVRATMHMRGISKETKNIKKIKKNYRGAK